MDFCGLLRVFESSQEVRKSEVIRLLGNKAYPHNRKKKNIFFCGQLASCFYNFTRARVHVYILRNCWAAGHEIISQYSCQNLHFVCISLVNKPSAQSHTMA